MLSGICVVWKYIIIKCGHKININSINALAKYVRLTLIMIVRQRNMNNFITVLYLKEMNCFFIYDCVTI